MQMYRQKPETQTHKPEEGDEESSINRSQFPEQWCSTDKERNRKDPAFKVENFSFEFMVDTTEK